MRKKLLGWRNRKKRSKKEKRRCTCAVKLDLYSERLWKAHTASTQRDCTGPSGAWRENGLLYMESTAIAMTSGPGIVVRTGAGRCSTYRRAGQCKKHKSDTLIVLNLISTWAKYTISTLLSPNMCKNWSVHFCHIWKHHTTQRDFFSLRLTHSPRQQCAQGDLNGATGSSGIQTLDPLITGATP